MENLHLTRCSRVLLPAAKISLMKSERVRGQLVYTEVAEIPI